MIDLNRRLFEILTQKPEPRPSYGPTGLPPETQIKVKIQEEELLAEVVLEESGGGYWVFLPFEVVNPKLSILLDNTENIAGCKFLQHALFPIFYHEIQEVK